MVETLKQGETQHSLIQEFKKELRDYEKKIKSNTLNKTQKESLEFSFAKGLGGLENNIKHLPENIQVRYKEIIQKLEDPNKEIASDDIHFIGELLDSFAKESKEIEYQFAVILDRTDLLALQESIKEVKEVKKSLSQLESTISGVNQGAPQVTKLAEKAKKYTEQLKVFKTEHPYWTKALMFLIPKDILATFFKTEQESDDFSKVNKVVGKLSKLTKSKIDTAGINKMLGQFKGWMITFLTFLFDIPWIGAPKEMQEFLANIKKDFGSLTEGQLAQIKATLGGGAADISDVAGRENFERLDGNIEQTRDMVINYIENKATDWFGLTNEEEKRKLKDTLSVWGKKWIKEGTEISRDLLDKIKKGKKLEFIDILNGLGAGIKAGLDLTMDLYQNGLLSLKQISFNIVEKGGQLMLSTALFFPKMLGLNLGEGSLDDVLEFVEGNQLIKEQKEVLYVMLYRALNSGPFSVLQHIAALPGYILSSIASAGQDVTKGKIFFEILKGNGIENQIKTLQKIEEKISGGEGKLYKNIKEAYSKYEKGIKISYSYGKAKNLEEFKALLKEAGLSTKDNVVQKLLNEMGPHFKADNKAIINCLNGLSQEIKNIDLAHGKGLPEVIKSSLGGIFGKTNFYKNSIVHLSTTLEHNASMFYEGWIFNKWQKLKGTLKYATSATGHIKMLNQAHLTNDITKLKDVAEDMRIIAQESPDLLRGIFRNISVILMGKEFIEGVKRGDSKYTDILKIYMNFVPIVGPITFALDKGGIDNMTNSEIATDAIWLGLDAWFVVSVKSFNVFKLAFMPVTESLRFGGYVTDMSTRYISGGKLKLSKIPRNIVGAAIVLSLVYLGYKFTKSEIEELQKNKEFKLLSGLSQKENGVELINSYLQDGTFNTLDKDTQEALLLSVLSINMKLSPDMIEKYINSIDIDGKNVNIIFTAEGKQSDLVKTNFESYLPTFELLLGKVGVTGYKIKTNLYT